MTLGILEIGLAEFWSFETGLQVANFFFGVLLADPTPDAT